MDAGAKQCLVDINVPKSGDDALVQEQGLHLPLTRTEKLGECWRREFGGEWLDAKSVRDVIELDICQEFDSTELAGVNKLQQRFVGEIQLHAKMLGERFLRRCWMKTEFAGHPQMHRDDVAQVESDNNQLRTAFDADDGSPDRFLNETLRFGIADRAVPRDPNCADGATADQRVEGGANGFDLG